MIVWFRLPWLRSDTNRTSSEMAADLAGISPSARQAALWAVTSQTPHRGWDSLLPSSSLRPVVGLVSVLLQEKTTWPVFGNCVRQLWWLPMRHHPQHQQLTRSGTSENLRNYSPSSTEKLTAESPLVVPAQNEMQQVEIILERQSPDVLSPFIVTVHFMPSDSLLWVKATWFNQKSTCNLHRLLSHLVSMLWSNRDCLQDQKKKKKDSPMSNSLLKY